MILTQKRGMGEMGLVLFDEAIPKYNNNNNKNKSFGMWMYQIWIELNIDVCMYDAY